MPTIVSTADRLDLVAVTGTWRWETFFKEKLTQEQALQLEEDCAKNGVLMPTVLVLLNEVQPVGMIALCLDDLDDRPEINPWLAGLYVDPPYRGRGYAAHLIRELEAFALRAGITQLSLYTSGAVGLYRKAGWSEIETFMKGGQEYVIMQKQLALR